MPFTRVEARHVKRHVLWVVCAVPYNYLAQWVEPDGIKANIVTIPAPKK
jgi:hypothetical protein